MIRAQSTWYSCLENIPKIFPGFVTGKYNTVYLASTYAAWGVVWRNVSECRKSGKQPSLSADTVQAGRIHKISVEIVQNFPAKQYLSWSRHWNLSER